MGSVKREQQLGVLRFPVMAADAVRLGKFFAADFNVLEVGAVRAGGVLPSSWLDGWFGQFGLFLVSECVAFVVEIVMLGNFRKGGVICCPAIQSAVVLPAEDGRLPRCSPECHHLFGVVC